MRRAKYHPMRLGLRFRIRLDGLILDKTQAHAARQICRHYRCCGFWISSPALANFGSGLAGLRSSCGPFPFPYPPEQNAKENRPTPVYPDRVPEFIAKPGIILCIDG